MGGLLSFWHKWIVGIGVLLCILVLGYNFKVAHSQKTNLYADSLDYVHLATALAKTGQYGFLEEGQQLLNDYKTKQVASKEYVFKQHDTWRAPLWPSFLGFILWVTGYSLTAVFVVKFLLLIIGGVLCFKILGILDFSRLWCFLGAFLYVLHPAGQIYSRFLLSEPFTLFLFTVFLYAIIRSYHQQKSFLLTAITGGLLVLSHPYYLFFPILVFGLLWMLKKINFKKMMWSCALVSGIVGFWVIRNAVVLPTSKIVITTSSGAVMAKGWNGDVVSDHNNINGDLADEALILNPEEVTALKALNEVERSALYASGVQRFVKENPEQIFPIILTKLRSAFNPFREYKKSGWLQTGRVCFHVLALLSLAVLVYYRKKEPLGFVLAMALVLSTICMAVITYSGFRFRMPQGVLELLLIIWAARCITQAKGIRVVS